MLSLEPSKRILIVEDDLPIQEVFVEILQNEGFKVEVANNGQEALDFLKLDAEFNLIMLDLMMPVCDGFSFRNEQLKHEVWSKIPVLVMSADGHITEKMERIKGAAYLRKPPDLEEMVQAVRKYCS